MRVRHFVLISALLATLAVPAGASASTLIDRNATGITLKVNASGQALLSYNARGKRWNVLAWNAVNAIPPTPGKRQVDFKLDYSGGWGTYKKDVWKTFANTCAKYTGPATRVARDELHGPGRQPLGAAVVAEDAAELRPRPEPQAGRVGAPALALDGRPAGAHRQHQLGLPEVRPHLRHVHLRRQPGPRLRIDVRRQPARLVRPEPLRRHVQLGVRSSGGSGRTAS